MPFIAQSRSSFGVAIRRPFQSLERAKAYVCKQLCLYIIQEYTNNNFTAMQYLDTNDDGNVVIAEQYKNNLEILESLLQPYLSSYMSWEIISSS